MQAQINYSVPFAKENEKMQALCTEKKVENCKWIKKWESQNAMMLKPSCTKFINVAGSFCNFQNKYNGC